MILCFIVNSPIRCSTSSHDHSRLVVLASPVVSSCPASHCSVLSFAVDEELRDIDKYHWLNISIKFHNVTLMKDLISSGVCV